MSRASTRHVLTGAVPLAVGITATAASFSLGVGSLTRPGSGLWPLIVGATLVAGSLGVLLSRPEKAEPFTADTLRIGAALAALVVFVALFERFGFVLPAGLLLAFWLRWLSRESWRMTLVVTSVAVAGFYVLFVVALGVPFPYDLVTGR